MIGSEIVSRLLESDYQVTVMHRGTNYWDYESRILPHVRYVKFNRKKPERCSLLADSTEFDLCVDCSGYKRKYMEPILKALQNRIGYYVYLSTDSVYEVCNFIASPTGITETDSVRPKNPEKRRKLARSESYGHQKLLCEELIQEFLKCPWLIVRLADVIGPRDNTNRFPCAWLCLLCSDAIDYRIPLSNGSQNISLIDSRDVADFVLFAIQQDIKNEIFNLAHQTPIQITDYLRLFGVGMFQHTVSSGEYPSYPSVECGCISSKKAVAAGFTFRETSKTVAESVQWYFKNWFEDRTCLKELREVLVDELKDDLSSTIFQNLLSHLERKFSFQLKTLPR